MGGGGLWGITVTLPQWVKIFSAQQQPCRHTPSVISEANTIPSDTGMVSITASD